MCVCVRALGMYVCIYIYTYARREKGLNLPYLSNCQDGTAPSPFIRLSLQ